MTPRGVEDKPTWSAVPRSVRASTEQVLGAPVARAQRAWGGYSPTPTFRLRLVDGSRAFFKAASPSSTPFAQVAHLREERVYAELGELIGPWAPSVLGSFVEGDWRVLLLEDLGPKSAPPWPAGLARNVARALAKFHRSTLERPVPAWVPRARAHPAFGIDPPAWGLERDEIDGLVGLTGDAARATSAWLETSVSVLADAARQLADPALRHALLHVDVRSDNLRWTRGRLRLFDWPHVGVGPPEFDVVAFAQAVAAEGGPEPEETIRGYAQALDPDPVALDASVAAVAGYFVRNAWLPEIPALPRVRGFQRRQLAASLHWAARRLGLPEPTWTDHMRPAPVPA
jgi:hypothetical protein